MELLACEQASLAAAVVADSYARWLQGDQIALSELATVQTAFLRVGSTLGFQRRAKDVTPVGARTGSITQKDSTMIWPTLPLVRSYSPIRKLVTAPAQQLRDNMKITLQALREIVRMTEPKRRSQDRDCVAGAAIRDLVCD